MKEEDTDILPQVLVSGRTQLSSGIKTESDDLKQEVCLKNPKDHGVECEGEAEPHGTGVLFWYIVLAAVKSVYEKCLLHKYLVCSLPPEPWLQD
jgi:hypothetical protein